MLLISFNGRQHIDTSARAYGTRLWTSVLTTNIQEHQYKQSETTAHGKISRESVFITAVSSGFKLIQMWGPGNQT